MDYHNQLFDPTFIRFLLKIDESIAAETRERGCPYCGSPLHQANYLRSGHGLPSDCSDIDRLRHSLCCSRDGCHRRCTPESVRFMNRRVYVSVAFVLLSILRQGPKPPRVKELRERVGVSRQTIDRWIRWWRKDFPISRFWREWQGRHPAVKTSQLPKSLLEAFSGQSIAKENLTALLRFLAPFAG